MLRLGCESNTAEKAKRLKLATRPITVHALVHSVIMGIKVRRLHRRYETSNPYRARLVANLWGASFIIKSGRQITIWID